MTSGEGIVGYLLSKIIPVVSGIFGGLTLSSFWMPKEIRKKGRIISILLIVLISGSMSFAFGPVILNYLNLESYNLNNIVAISYMTGALSLAVANWIGNFFIKNEKKDITEVITIVRDTKNGVKNGES